MVGDSEESQLFPWDALPASLGPDLSYRGAIQRFWDGKPMPSNRHVDFLMGLTHESLVIRWRAPSLKNESPEGTVGPLWELWKHDVVEFFFLGSDEHYLELEFGPYGHYLVLELKGVREIIRRMLPLKTSVHAVDEEWWYGAAEIPLSYLPQPVQKWNAYAIYEENNKRHFCALHPGEGPPDFHQLAAFSTIPFPIKYPEMSSKIRRRDNASTAHLTRGKNE